MEYYQLRRKVDKCHKESRNFKYGPTVSIGQIYRNPFLFNQYRLGGKNNPNHVYKKALAEEKGLTKKEMDLKYWNALLERYKQSIADTIAIKKQLIEYLENELYPFYFDVLNTIKGHFFENEYSEKFFCDKIHYLNNILRIYYCGYLQEAKQLTELNLLGKIKFKETASISLKTINDQLLNMLLIKNGLVINMVILPQKD